MVGESVDVERGKHSEREKERERKLVKYNNGKCENEDVRESNEVDVR